MIKKEWEEIIKFVCNFNKNVQVEVCILVVCALMSVWQYQCGYLYFSTKFYFIII